jgi:ribosome-binding ATPase YchF (GTP1/OBG family)
MKICLFAMPGVPLGKHNLKDPRLDEADRLVEAKKKTYAQVDVVGQEDALTADAILVPRESLLEVIFLDLEFIETRLSRGPTDAEKVVLEKLKTKLEQEIPVFKAGLSAEDMQAVAAHQFHTNKPVVAAEKEELENPETLLVRAFGESGGISFLTVGGKENRAWPILKGATAFEAAGSIHTDIQKGFIRAEVISYADFVGAGGETQAKRAGKQRLELKTYLVQDYDVVNFRFNK